MVWDNPFIKLKSVSPAGSQIRDGGSTVGASLLDRILSFIIDMVIWLPLSKLIFASYKKQILGQMLTESDLSVDLMMQMLVFAGAYVFLFIVVYSLFLAFIGATPGQLILGIRVMSRETLKPPSLLVAGARGCLFVLSLVTGGWPLLAAFGHSKRMCFHDLATDTVTLSRKPQTITGEYLQYRPFLRTYYLMTTSLLITFLLTTLYAINEKAKLKSLSFVDQVKPFCQELPEGIHFYDSAISAFLVGAVDEECLLSFSDKIFHSPAEEFDPKWSYFAKYLTNSEDPELQAQYHKALCEQPDSQACQWIKLYQHQIGSVGLEKLRPQNLLEKVLLIRSANHYQDYDLAFTALKELPKHQAFKSIHLSLTTAYHSTRNPSYEHDKMFIEIMQGLRSDSHFIDPLEMMCDFKLSRSCHNQSMGACKTLFNQPEYLGSSSNHKILLSRLGRGIQASICDGAELPGINQALSVLPFEERRELQIFLKLVHNSKLNIDDKLEQQVKLLKKKAMGSRVHEQLLVRFYQILAHKMSQDSSHRWASLRPHQDFYLNWSSALLPLKAIMQGRMIASDSDPVVPSQGAPRAKTEIKTLRDVKTKADLVTEITPASGAEPETLGDR